MRIENILFFLDNYKIEHDLLFLTEMKSNEKELVDIKIYNWYVSIWKIKLESLYFTHTYYRYHSNTCALWNRFCLLSLDRHAFYVHCIFTFILFLFLLLLYFILFLLYRHLIYHGTSNTLILSGWIYMLYLYTYLWWYFYGNINSIVCVERCFCS